LTYGTTCGRATMAAGIGEGTSRMDGSSGREVSISDDSVDGATLSTSLSWRATGRVGRDSCCPVLRSKAASIPASIPAAPGSCRRTMRSITMGWGTGPSGGLLSCASDPRGATALAPFPALVGCGSCRRARRLMTIGDEAGSSRGRLSGSAPPCDNGVPMPSPSAARGGAGRCWTGCCSLPPTEGWATVACTIEGGVWSVASRDEFNELWLSGGAEPFSPGGRRSCGGGGGCWCIGCAEAIAAAVVMPSAVQCGAAGGSPCNSGTDGGVWRGPLAKRCAGDGTGI
jgi:hypothetical protein